MGADCCAGDPSQSKMANNMDTIAIEQEGVVPETEESRDSGEEQRDTKPAKKERVRDDSHLNPPDAQNTEESLNVPSTLSAIGDDHDPVPHSDYEENTEQYAVKQDENNANEDDEDRDEDDNTAVDNAESTKEDDNDENVENEATEEAVEDVKEDRGADEDEGDNVEQEDEAPPKAADVSNETAPKKVKLSRAEKQLEILQNEELKQRSVAMVTEEFIKFLNKIFKSKLNDKIWAKCDPNNTNRIETDKFVYFWNLPVTLFKVAVHQRTHNTKEKPKLDNKELKKDFKHLAHWIIRCYGEQQEDGSYAFSLTKENYTKNIVTYARAYADCHGDISMV